MNRRGFLKFLGITPAVPIAAKAAAAIPVLPAAAVAPEVAAAPVATAMAAGAISTVWAWSVSIADVQPSVCWSTSLTDSEGEAKN